MTGPAQSRPTPSRLTILFGLTLLEAAVGLIVMFLLPGERLFPGRVIAALPLAVLLFFCLWGTWVTYSEENEPPPGKPRGIEDRNTQEQRSKLRDISILRKRDKSAAYLLNWFQSSAGLPRFFLVAFLTALGILLQGIAFLPDSFLKEMQSTASAIALLCGLSGLIAVEWAAAWWLEQKKGLPSLPLRHLGTFLAGLVFLISVLIRLPLAGYALPYQSVWDEVVTYPDALRMFAEPGLKPDSYVPAYGNSAYGDLLTYVAFAGDTIGYLGGMRSGAIHSVSEFTSPPQGASIYEAVQPAGIPLQFPRLLIILINSLTPVFVFLILRKIFRVNTGLSFGAALIYAVFSREVLYYSSFILPDAPATTVTALLFLIALKAMRTGGKKWLPWFACGILSGIVVSINIRNLLVLLVPVLAFLLARRKGAKLWILPISLLGALAGFVLTSPYSALDFPAYIQRVSALYWGLDTSLMHRLASLVFYLRGLFALGFESTYVDSTGGSVGFGILVGILALVGIYRGITRFPRQTLLVLIFSAAQLYLVLPITQNYTRHILILYPLICVLAGIGLAELASLLRRPLDRLRESNRPARGHFAPAIVLAAFLLLHVGQLILSVRYVQSTAAFRPSQVQAADYLQGILQPGDVVGLQADVPFVEASLTQRGIAFQRVSSADTIAELQAKGITYVIGTDRLGGDYLAAAPSLWENYFQSPGAILATFGKDTLEAMGYPVADLYLFVGRVPGE